MGYIQCPFGDFHPPPVELFSGTAHPGLEGHPALDCFLRHVVHPAVLDETRPRLDKTEGDIPGLTFPAQPLHPLKVAGPRAVIVLPATDDLLDLAASQILFQAHRPDQGRTHDPLVLEGEVQQDRDALIRPLLVFTGDVKEDC